MSDKATVTDIRLTDTQRVSALQAEIDSINIRHQREMSTLKSNNETLTKNAQHYVNQIRDLQDKVLAEQTKVIELQDKFLNLREIVNAP